MEIDILVELAVRAGIGKIHSLIRLHGDKDLYQGKQACKHPFAGVFFNLVICLADIDPAALELAMEQRHPVDEQHEIAPPVRQEGASGFEYRLFSDLITALPGGDLHPVIDF